MKAAYITQFGGPEVLEVGELDDPKPRNNQVLIRVNAAAVNPRDWLLREGRYVFRHLVGGFPIIPGSDVSGVVEQVGSAVAGFSAGDPVFAMQTTFGRMGGYAEKIAVHASAAAHKPDSVSHVDAAAVPVAGLTAWQALRDLIGVEAGMRIVIVGASGGVGTYAVQMANSAGAEVIGVCSEPNHALVSELGAKVTIDYHRQHFRQAVSGADAVFDTIGRESMRTCGDALRPGGVYVTTIPGVTTARDALVSKASRWVRRGHKRTEVILVKPRGDDLADIAAKMVAGKVRSIIERVYPLSDVADAHRLSRTFRARGKIVLAI